MKVDSEGLEIIGRGMIARAAAQCFRPSSNVLFFAAGTGSSAACDDEVFAKERRLLQLALQRCELAGRRLVYCSSAGRVYCDPNAAMADENTPCNPICAYGRNKLACEQLIRSHSGSHLILRLANLVGYPQNRSQLLPALIEQCQAGTVRVQTGATRDLLGVEDLFPIVNEILKNSSKPETVVVATGLATSVTDIVGWIRGVLGTNLNICYLDGGRPQVFSTEKMRRLAPSCSDFSPDYPRRIVERYTGISRKCT